MSNDLGAGARLGASAAAVAGLLILAATLIASTAQACPGDCNTDGKVGVQELVGCVHIALAMEPAARCRACDHDADGSVSIDEIVGAVEGALGGCPAEPIFPANYRDTFTEVRSCRFSVEHDLFYIRVLANPAAAEPYRQLANPLPVGSIVIKEEFNSPGCNDGDLARYRVMRKEGPGFDPDDGDWHWQEVSPQRAVTIDGKQTCVGCHQRTECLARDYMCTEGGLTLVMNQLPPALLSITGTSASDVYAVGADPRDGFGPYVLHYEGQRWRRLNTGTTGSDLWWISVTPIGGAFYMVGENGLILRYVLPATPGGAGTFEKQTAPGTALLYGVWGVSADDIWAVGGDPEEPDTGGVIWHYDGNGWSALDTQAIREGGLPILFKVWGRSAGEVYAVGREGVILRFNGTSWTEVSSALDRDLFTIHGNDSLVTAVGGAVDAYLVELENGEFVDRTPANAMQLNGVFVPPDGKAIAVGNLGSAVVRIDGGWENFNTAIDTQRDFHATWVDPEGGIWAVGGNLNDFNAGILAYGGQRTIGSEIIEIDPCPAATTTGGPTTVSYSRDIRPIFEASGCMASNCHGGAFPAAAYDMRVVDRLFGPGAAAKSLGLCDIVPGNAEASFLIEALGPGARGNVRQMPINGPPLAESDIQLLRTWILEGAQDDSLPTPTRTATRRVTPSPTRTPSRTSTGGAQTVLPTATPPPTVNTTPAAVCNEPGIICTMAGTGASLFDGDGKPALGTAFYWPIRVAFDRNDRPLILDWNNLRLRRINTDGRVQTLMGDGFERPPEEGALASETSLHHASDVEYDADGRLYIAGYHVPYAFRVETNNHVSIVAGRGEVGNNGDGGSALEARLTSPYAVVPTTDGGVYISDIDAHAIRYVDAEGLISTVAGKAGTIKAGYKDGSAAESLVSSPAGMALEGDGSLYFADKGNHVVRKIDPEGMITTIAGTGQPGYAGDNGPARQAQFESPRGLLLGPEGELYIADSGNSVIRRLRNGTVTTVVGNGDERFGGDMGSALNAALRQPLGMSLAADGSLWIADTFNNRVRRVAHFLDTQN